MDVEDLVATHYCGAGNQPRMRAVSWNSEKKVVRFRTIGDMTCTGAVESSATSIDQVIEEVAATRLTERGATRADDRVTEAAMEDRKKEGYF